MQELQNKLAVIEATRGENYDALQSELLRLRRMREELERSIAGSKSRAVNDYEVPQEE